MTTMELKNVLMHQISKLDDVALLKALKTILDAQSNNQVVTLTMEERREILASKKEVGQGLFIEGDELDKEIDQWLKENNLVAPCPHQIVPNS